MFLTVQSNSAQLETSTRGGRTLTQDAKAAAHLLLKAARNPLLPADIKEPLVAIAPILVQMAEKIERLERSTTKGVQ